MKISIIIICKNEEKVIDKCIKSSIISIKEFGMGEIILVDSNSEDKTLTIALETFAKMKFNSYKIIKIESNYYTAALARNIGMKESNGEFLLFLDGDMILYKNFLENINYIKGNIVGLVGKRYDITDLHNVIIKEFVRDKKFNNKIIDIGGAVLLHREKIGNIKFNPIQKTREEETMAKKLSLNKKYINYLNEKMYIHIDYKRKERSLFKRINQINQTIIDLKIAVKDFYKKVGIKKTFYLYKEYIFNFIVIPIAILFLFLFGLSMNKLLVVIAILSLMLYVIKFRLRSIFSILLLKSFIINTDIKQEYNILEYIDGGIYENKNRTC
ncbi:glycosyltransferase [Clostridium perfringens]|uniref:glycosyltransferase family 2 protein n=1 Tax=Clostridium perfringens TaxID=1502 RepID=UPI002AC70D21|nr:glycosyltransferase family 2 protein [Clostridium perfringens]MDZ5043697.1 glycosyltransferase [Clostridium perfringens]